MSTTTRTAMSAARMTLPPRAGSDASVVTSSIRAGIKHVGAGNVERPLRRRGRSIPPAGGERARPASGRLGGRHHKAVRRFDAELGVKNLDGAIELVVVALVHGL